MKHFFTFLILGLTTSVISSCAYNLSTKHESLPGNVTRVQIPIFKNLTAEPGAEVFFTNSLKLEALRSRVTKVENEEANAEAILQGTLATIDVIADESVMQAENNPYLPKRNVLAVIYHVTVSVDLVLKRKGTNTVLWSGNFKQTKNFPAAQITLPVINSSNSLYNQSAKRQTLDALSKEMMQAGFDRMVEDF
jgi:hypothetical protein